jgi:hypothetical protein
MPDSFKPLQEKLRESRLNSQKISLKETIVIFPFWFFSTLSYVNVFFYALKPTIDFFTKHLLPNAFYSVGLYLIIMLEVARTYFRVMKRVEQFIISKGNFPVMKEKKEYRKLEKYLSSFSPIFDLACSLEEMNNVELDQSDIYIIEGGIEVLVKSREGAIEKKRYSVDKIAKDILLKDDTLNFDEIYKAIVNKMPVINNTL